MVNTPVKALRWFKACFVEVGDDGVWLQRGEEDIKRRLVGLTAPSIAKMPGLV